MIKQILKICALGLIAAVVAVAPVRAADDVEKPATEATPKPKSIPFRGKLKSVDKTAMTITVGERTFQITSETKISKDGKPGVLDDGVVGDNVGGAYKKSDDGKMTATTVNFTKAEAAPAKEAPMTN